MVIHYVLQYWSIGDCAPVGPLQPLRGTSPFDSFWQAYLSPQSRSINARRFVPIRYLGVLETPTFPVLHPRVRRVDFHCLAGIA
jgi:hypothetical protein